MLNTGSLFSSFVYLYICLIFHLLPNSQLLGLSNDSTLGLVCVMAVECVHIDFICKQYL